MSCCVDVVVVSRCSDSCFLSFGSFGLVGVRVFGTDVGLAPSKLQVVLLASLVEMVSVLRRICFVVVFVGVPTSSLVVALLQMVQCCIVGFATPMLQRCHLLNRIHCVQPDGECPYL